MRARSKVDQWGLKGGINYDRLWVHFGDHGPMELFEAARPKPEARLDLIPLADRIRPDRLEDFVGQEHLLGPERFLRSLIEKDQLQSLIF